MHSHILPFSVIHVSILSCLLACSVPVFALTRYVDLNNPSPAPPYTSWATAATVIQDAVDACSSGDEVIVTNGVYDVGGAPTPSFSLSNRVCITIPITVRSVNGPGVTIILGEGPTGSFATRCVYIVNGANLSGFFLKNGGTFSDGNARLEESGGGVLFYYGGIITNCIIGGGAAQSYGGGAYCYLGGILYDCIITGNVAGIGAGGVQTYLSSTRIENCTISGNTGYDGGGVLISDGDRVIGCTIAGNFAVHSGGGIKCYSGSQILNCNITGNSNGFEGGGIYCYTDSIISNCIVSENISSRSGGGIYCYQGGNLGAKDIFYFESIC